MKRTTVFLLVLVLSLSMWTQSTQRMGNAVASAPVAVTSQSAQGNPDVKVWVNTDSNVYHCPGTRWYGATKHGVYLTQAEAQKKGYRPAYGKVCR